MTVVSPETIQQEFKIEDVNLNNPIFWDLTKANPTTEKQSRNRNSEFGQLKTPKTQIIQEKKEEGNKEKPIYIDINNSNFFKLNNEIEMVAKTKR